MGLISFFYCITALNASNLVLEILIHHKIQGEQFVLAFPSLKILGTRPPSVPRDLRPCWTLDWTIFNVLRLQAARTPQ